MVRKEGIKFTVVMASLLSPYKGAATDRIRKFHRAVESVLGQIYEDFELFIIADGCEITMREAARYADERITCRMVEKQDNFSGRVRNFGIWHAANPYIVYLDTDDYMGARHLALIANGLEQYDWVYFDDWQYNHKRCTFVSRKCDIRRRFRHGTSNICHHAKLEALWLTQGYLHDYYFVLSLLNRSNNHAYIGQGDYYVCHVPQRYDI